MFGLSEKSVKGVDGFNRLACAAGSDRYHWESLVNRIIPRSGGGCKHAGL
jgi:hypothetical protein